MASELPSSLDNTLGVLFVGEFVRFLSKFEPSRAFLMSNGLTNTGNCAVSV